MGEDYRNRDFSTKKFSAFISYKRGDIDSAVAEKLQRKIEQYRGTSTEKKKRLGKVFLDKNELVSNYDFFEQLITPALVNSDWLIIICSSETSKSEWVEKEIHTFIESHNNSCDHIMALMTGGEPAEILPPALAEKSAIDRSDGRHVEEIVLAADIRGKNKHQILKKLDGDEFYRLLAPMLNVDFDDLVRREHRRNIRRIEILISVIFTFLAIFTGYALFKNYELNNALRTVQLEQSKTLTREAELNLEKGDKASAIQSLIQALSMEGDERPFYPEAQNLLTSALNLYSPVYDDSTLVADAVIDETFDQYYTKYYIDEEGKYLFTTIDSGTTIQIWNVQTLKKEMEYSIVGDDILPGTIEDVLLLDDNRILIYTFHKVFCIDYCKDQVLWTKDIDFGGIEKIFVPTEWKDVSYILVSDTSQNSLLRVLIIDNSSGDTLYNYDGILEETDYYLHKAAVSTDGRFLAILTSNEFYIGEIDMAGNLQFKTCDYFEIGDKNASGGVNFEFYDENNLIVLYEEDGASSFILEDYDVLTDKIRWTNSEIQDFAYLGNIYIYRGTDTNPGWIIETINNHATAVDPDTGESFRSFNLDGDIIAVFADSDPFQIITNTGKIMYGDDKGNIYIPGTIEHTGDTLIKAENCDIYFSMSANNEIIRYEAENTDDNWNDVMSMCVEARPYCCTPFADEAFAGYRYARDYIHSTSDTFLICKKHNEEASWELTVQDVLQAGEINLDNYGYVIFLEDENNKLKYLIINPKSYNDNDGYLCTIDMNAEDIETVKVFSGLSYMHIMDTNDIHYDSANNRLYIWNDQDIGYVDTDDPEHAVWFSQDWNSNIEAGSSELLRGANGAGILVVSNTTQTAYIYDADMKNIIGEIDLSDYSADFFEQCSDFNNIALGDKYIALPDGDKIHVYRKNGKEILQISYDDYKDSDGSEFPLLSLSDNEKYLYVFLNDNALRYNMTNGNISGQIDLEQQLVLSASSEISCYLDQDPDIMRILIRGDDSFGDSKSSVYLKLYFSEVSSGITMQKDDVFAYDSDKKQIYSEELFYDIDEDFNTDPCYHIGYFPEYTLEEILKMAEEKLN